MSAVFPPLDDHGFAPSMPDREIAQLRVPPHSIEAESSVLGGLLLDNNAWDRVGDLLKDGDFYRYEHKLIYAAIGGLINGSKPADVITVYEQLQGLGKAEEIGGLGYLNNLAQYVPSASNIRRYSGPSCASWSRPAMKSPPTPSIRRASRWTRSSTRPSKRSSTSVKKALG